MRRTLAALALGGLSIAVAVACSQPPMPQALRGLPRCPLTLGPEDVVTVRVFGEDQLSGDYQADTSGNINFPFVGATNITGKTNTSLAGLIREQLQSGQYMVDPQVSVVIKEHNSARVSVDGRVARPGTFPFQSGMTIVEVISQAGGMTPLAAPNQTRLTRTTDEGAATLVVPVRAIRMGQEADVRLCPGDQVYVPESPL